jgi:transcriptional regulator of arginine metabolism
MDSKILLEIIRKHQPKDQSELLELLGKNGIQSTQATLSRQLKRLDIIKIEGVYKQISKPSFQTSSIVSVTLSPPNLLLIKTLPGHANAVAFGLEQQEMPEIAGTIAGDDTLMVAVVDPSLLKLLKQKIEQIR